MRDNERSRKDRSVPPDQTQTNLSQPGAGPAAWDGIADRLRASGLRWTPQRRTLIDVLREHAGHVTASELIARCKERDRTTTPSTVYRTLDMLEDLGLVKHGHGPDGREEYHILPAQIHGHLHCVGCGATWEISPETGAAIVDALSLQLGFTVDLSHVTISGRCAGCHD
jgi:Fur family transcriptional regulator, ferric uptake regulator